MGMEDLSIDITYDPVSFRWTVPLDITSNFYLWRFSLKQT